MVVYFAGKPGTLVPTLFLILTDLYSSILMGQAKVLHIHPDSIPPSLPCLVPSVSINMHHFTQSESSLRLTRPNHCNLFAILGRSWQAWRHCSFGRLTAVNFLSDIACFTLHFCIPSLKFFVAHNTLNLLFMNECMNEWVSWFVFADVFSCKDCNQHGWNWDEAISDEVRLSA